jgi:thiol-disulfide isomerase/thioredoxin
MLLSLAFAWTAISQTAPAGQPAGKAPAADEKKQPAARETPPDEKAYAEAGRVNDPARKIEALEKFRKDFPASSRIDSANLAILTALTRLPNRNARIREQAKLVYKAAAKNSKGRALGVTEAVSIADALLAGSVLLKDAESYAKKGLKSMDQARYIKEQLANYEKRKQKPPSQEDLAKRFRESRASRLATLGRVELALGNDKRSKELLEEAYKDLPTSTAVQGSLGELAARQGDNPKAMDLLVAARLAGRTAPSTVAALESVYRQTHNNTLDGFESMLDSAYRQRFPNPLKLEPYKPAEKRGDRMVLGEVFTGAGCPPCVAADLAFDAAMQRYSRKELAVVMYHEHIPRPDPMTNPDTQARYKAYEGAGVPTFAIDGKTTVGGGSRDNTKSVYDGSRGFNKDIEKDLETPAEAQLNLSASIANGVVKVNAAVDKVKSESKDLKLQVLLVEKELTYSGENGVRFHPMVVRAMGGPKAEGFALAGAGPATFDETFDVAKVSAALKAHLDDYESKGHRGEPFQFVEKKFQIDARDLAVVAFVQDAQTKHVLQAAYVDLAGPAVGMVGEQ